MNHTFERAPNIYYALWVMQKYFYKIRVQLLTRTRQEIEKVRTVQQKSTTMKVMKPPCNKRIRY